jgi:hypothetical protein
VSSSMMLPTEVRRRGRRHHADPLRIEAFARRQQPTPRQRVRCRHSSATPPRRKTTPAGTVAAGPTRAEQDFHPCRRTSPTLLELGQNRPMILFVEGSIFDIHTSCQSTNGYAQLILNTRLHGVSFLWSIRERCVALYLYVTT